jgi:hypothetical protein
VSRMLGVDDLGSEAALVGEGKAVFTAQARTSAVEGLILTVPGGLWHRKCD